MKQKMVWLRPLLGLLAALLLLSGVVVKLTQDYFSRAKK